MSRSKTAPLSTFVADRHCRRLWPLTVNALSVLCAERHAQRPAASIASPGPLQRDVGQQAITQ